MALVHDKNLVKLKRAAALSRQNALAEDISGNTDAALVSVLAADLIESVISDLEASNSPSQNAA